MAEKETPLLRQYNQIKKKYPDTVLLFRLGDFFETFNEDAAITSKVCGITLTKRNNGAAGEMPLAGFPFHQLDAYLPKLVRAGYRVAVCEQLEDPKKARGIVKRDVIEVVTPGVALYDKLLDNKRNNYVAALFIKHDNRTGNHTGIAFADISTGEFFCGEFQIDMLNEVLESLTPAEILIAKSQKTELSSEVEKCSFSPAVTKLEPWIFDVEFGREALLGHFKTQNLKGFGIEGLTAGLASAGAVLHYIKETQNGKVSQFKSISYFEPSEFMTLDYSTRRNLEITFSYAEGAKEGTLISILDKTSTPMGGRLLKKWITRPLKKLDNIQNRLDAVKIFFERDTEREKLRTTLSGFSDLERLISKVCSSRANPRDLISLMQSCDLLPKIKEILESIDEKVPKYLANKIEDLSQLVDLIKEALVDEPTAQTGTGNVFRKNYNTELDSFIEAKYSGKKWIADFQESERQRSGIPSLKVGFNNVFGYYIEVTNAHKSKIPQDYERKQTLTGAERYTTKQLKEIESKIFNAEEKISEIENALFTELLMKVALFTEKIQSVSANIAVLDCLLNFASISKEYNYCEPQVDESDELIIEDGRHPVVERLLGFGERFTPNSTKINCREEMIHIITGPNMSGKSCYLRQVGLIVLLAQIGCFVPAKSAKIGLVDRIFTRVGASDNITAGESTFLVEMQEAANIINNATSKSLILLDEIGRGTATFDGISIAWAITEYIHNVINSRTLFATHYHELNELTETYEKIANYRVEVIETGSSVIFSHKVKSGGSDHSFGIYVAQMAGLPEEVVKRAYSIMKTLEESTGTTDKEEKKQRQKPDTKSIKTKISRNIPEQLSIFEFRDDSLREKLMQLDLNSLTPIQALQVLADLVKEAKG